LVETLIFKSEIPNLNQGVAKDRQTPFSLNAYLNPTLITIPQYNFRIGYFISKNYDISFGVDRIERHDDFHLAGYG